MASIDWFIERGLYLMDLRRAREVSRWKERQYWDLYHTLCCDPERCPQSAYSWAKDEFDRGLELDDRILAAETRMLREPLDPPTLRERFNRLLNRW